MVTGREPQQVAKRALILGTIAFRASLEVTDHPRVVEISKQMLPWLREMGCKEELDPIERELLDTPFGNLSDSQMTDANWAGEAAMLFCWMLTLVGPPEPANPVDQSKLPSLLSILKPAALAILRQATLRELTEIQEMCEQVVLVRSILQETRVGPSAGDHLRRIGIQRLREVGLAISHDAVKRAAETVARMTPDERSGAAGLIFVREHAALWYFSDRSNYFA